MAAARCVLPDAVRPHEQQPAVRRLGERQRLAVRVLHPLAVVDGEVQAADVEAVERHLADQRVIEHVERAQVRRRCASRAS